MHARCPWMVVWDDHEFDNNYADDISEEKGVDPAEFLIRRANAYQAYYEMMPLRSKSLPRGPQMQLYRKLSFGRLAEFLVLDTRQYRTRSAKRATAITTSTRTRCRPKNTMLGSRQRDWLQKTLIESAASWNVLAQQMMMGLADKKAGEGQLYSMDSWPGYAYERRRLLEFLRDRRVPNPVVLTGDIHTNWVNDLRVDDHKPETPVVATEFVGTSISSSGDGADKLENSEADPVREPVRSIFQSPARLRSLHGDARRSGGAISKCSSESPSPHEPISTRASFVIEAGTPGAKQA